MRLFDRFRRPAADPAPRRAFFRRLSGLDAGRSTSAGDAPPARFVPGTLVDARGWPKPRTSRGVSPYLGEITIFTYQRGAPEGYLPCDGRLVSISEYEALYNLLATRYGGDGQTTFGLPDLRSRTPVGQGQGPGLDNVTLGQAAGNEDVTLTTAQMPVHTHGFKVAVSSALGTTADPTGAVLAQPASGIPQYVTTGATGTLATASLGGTTTATGESQSFDNRDPYLGLLFAICTEGLYPPQA